LNITDESRFRILIVDDNEAIHQDLRKILLPSQDTASLDEDEAVLFGTAKRDTVSFELDSAFQGPEALEKVESALAASDPYALAFIDIRMPPGWDGIETIERVWGKDRDLQVVICTAYSDYNWQDIERRVGLSHNLVVLKKPFDPIEVTQLAHALTAKWKGSRQMREQLKELDLLVEKRTAELRSTVEELERAKEQAEAVSLEDPLTKLPNRRLFMRRLTLSLERFRETAEYCCAVLYLDVDRFKLVNDSLGHVAGDELLVEIADRLKTSLREGGGRFGSEDLIARLGGDEFAILLDGIRDKSDAVRVSQRLCSFLASPFVLRGREMACSASVGIVISDGRYIDPEPMMRDADAAMYRAKEMGGGAQVLFDESMHLYNLDRLHKESELRQALDRGEFFLCYQPIVSLATGLIIGSEALVRWQSPSRGLVTPVDFIPLCEENGLIVPVGAWTLKEACDQIKLWQKKFGGDIPPVSINLSARQFRQPDLVWLVKRALLSAGLSSRCIRMELTETTTMSDPKRAAAMLSQLRDIGVRLSIDDFGTGYSSLSYLHQFSVDTLKIDKSFVNRMSDDDRSANIVKTIISLAHNLSMQVVAEGVESQEQLDQLRSLGCDAAQGYFFSRPVRSEVLMNLIEKEASQRFVRATAD